jgi:hypothetical protein
MPERELMSWGVCLKEHIKSIYPDAEKARALLKMAALRNEFWSNLKFDAKYTSIVVEGYYETIKELLTALLYLEGLKSDNHECLIAYLKEHYPGLAYEISIMHQLKKVRNDIDYQGFFVKPDYLERNKLEFNHIIETLQKTVKEKLSEV